MRPKTNICATAATLIACVAVLACEAAYQPASPVETGQPRELINRPGCWAPDNFGDWRHCELSQDIDPCVAVFCAA